MSSKLQQQVWEHAPYIGEKMLMLLAMAEWANDEGYCAVAADRLADKVRITEDCAKTLLQGFIDDGALRLIAPAINSQPAFYQMLSRCWSDDPHPATAGQAVNFTRNHRRERKGK